MYRHAESVLSLPDCIRALTSVRLNQTSLFLAGKTIMCARIMFLMALLTKVRSSALKQNKILPLNNNHREVTSFPAVLSWSKGEDATKKPLSATGASGGFLVFNEVHRCGVMPQYAASFARRVSFGWHVYILDCNRWLGLEDGAGCSSNKHLFTLSFLPDTNFSPYIYNICRLNFSPQSAQLC